MTAITHIVDGRGNNTRACVTQIGALIVSPFKYDEVVYNELAAINTAYNFYESLPGQQFVITGMRIKADRQVSSTVDADVVIYEATSSSTTDVSKILHQEAMVRGENVTMLPMNILVNEGVFINAKTTDDDIHMTIMGYPWIVTGKRL